MQHLKANLGRSVYLFIYFKSHMKSTYQGGTGNPQEGYIDITNCFLVLLLLGFGFVF